MIGLSRTSVYAVHALSGMAEGTSQTCVIRDLAQFTGIPRPYLAKIVNRLNHHGLVQAKRGCRGGIVLSRPPEKISILEVIEAVEGKDWITDCLLGMDCCAFPDLCPTRRAWTKVRGDITEILRTTTLAHVMVFAGLGKAGNRKRQAKCDRARGKASTRSNLPTLSGDRV